MGLTRQSKGRAFSSTQELNEILENWGNKQYDYLYCKFNSNEPYYTLDVKTFGIESLSITCGGGQGGCPKDNTSDWGRPGAVVTGTFKPLDYGLSNLYLYPGENNTPYGNNVTGEAGNSADVRTINGAWGDLTSLRSRIIVGGGGVGGLNGYPTFNEGENGVIFPNEVARSTHPLYRLGYSSFYSRNGIISDEVFMIGGGGKSKFGYIRQGGGGYFGGVTGEGVVDYFATGISYVANADSKNPPHPQGVKLERLDGGLPGNCGGDDEEDKPLSRCNYSTYPVVVLHDIVMHRKVTSNKVLIKTPTQWKHAKEVYVKTPTAWKTLKDIYVKKNGVWHKIG